MDLLAEIDGLVDTGRRAPGSDAERRAARHLQRRLTGLGREAEIESIDVWPQWPLAYALLAAMSVVGSVLAVEAPALGAALTLAGALLLVLDAGLLLPTLRRLLGRRSSQNVISWADGDKRGALILVAHYDAGRGGLALSAGRRRTGLGPLAWTQLAVLACCLLRLAGLDGLPLTIVQFVPTALLIVAIALLLDIALSGTRGGENDNASGVALALRLVERFGGGARQRLEHFDLHVLFTGGQNAVAAGMRSFLSRHERALDRGRTVFLNLDEVGWGTVRYSRREGPLLTLRTHVQLTDLCAAIAEDAEEENGARPFVNRSAGDGYAARSAGLAALTVSCRDDRGRATARVEEDAIERAEAFCAELIRRLDAEAGDA